MRWTMWAPIPVISGVSYQVAEHTWGWGETHPTYPQKPRFWLDAGAHRVAVF